MRSGRRVSFATPDENASSIRFQTRCPPRRLAVCSRSAAGGQPTLGRPGGPGRDVVPLSEHEQRLFEQIERSLAEDPKFASAVRASDPRFHARRRVLLAGGLVLVGLALLIYGVADPSPLLGVAGFVGMLGSVAFAIQSVG